jgi:hypothetical protein
MFMHKIRRGMNSRLCVGLFLWLCMTMVGVHTVHAGSPEPLKSNPVSCFAAELKGVRSTGEFACYGLMTRNSYFITAKDAPCQASGKNVIGCVIPASVCQSGQALAVTHYDISNPDLFTFNIYSNLKITDSELRRNVASVWEYVCTEKLSPTKKPVDVLVRGVSRSSVQLPATAAPVPFAVRAPSNTCKVTTMYGTRTFVPPGNFFYLSPVSEHGPLRSVAVSCKEGRRTIRDSLRVTIDQGSRSDKRDVTVLLNDVLQTTIKNISRTDALSTCLGAEKFYQNGAAGKDEMECFWGTELMKRVGPEDWKG